MFEAVATKRPYTDPLTLKGNYGCHSRVLFYCTIVFGLLASRLKWLVAGTLAAALTYSGTAAIQACLLVWYGPLHGELDLYALTIILSMSSLVTVPSIDWSGIFRNLGSGDGHSGARATIIYWGGFFWLHWDF